MRRGRGRGLRGAGSGGSVPAKGNLYIVVTLSINMTPQVNLTQTTIEAETETGVHITHVALLFHGNDVIDYLVLRTEFHPY